MMWRVTSHLLNYRCLSNCITRNIGQLKNARFLYSAYCLGLESFVSEGEQIYTANSSSEKQFVNKMERILHSSDEKDVVFTDDLKKLIAFCQKDQSYLPLVLGLCVKHMKAVENLNIKPYTFGPVVMRLLHTHKLADETFKVILDETMSSLFCQSTSYQLAMDLLYDSGRHHEVLRLMDEIMEKDKFPLPTSCVTLAVASYYKTNTDEALEKCLDLVHKLSELNKRPTFRMLAFVSALALKRDKPLLSLESLSHASSSEHFLISNLKILSLVDLGKFEDVLDLLKIKTLIDIPKHNKSSPFKQILAVDTVDHIERKVAESLRTDLISNFAHVKSVLHNMDLVSPVTLESSLCATIDIRRPNEKPRYRSRTY